MSTFPQTLTDFFALRGGLDMVTPAIAQPAGNAFDAQNYEPAIAGGYRRIDGFERFDGRASPTRTAQYALLRVTETVNVAVGSNIIGAISGASARILAKSKSGDTTTYTLGRISGEFFADENVFLGDSTTLIAHTLSIALQADFAEDAADCVLLAVNNLRADIGKVPGSGPVRGVAVLNDVVYAFRDNVPGTAGDIYKATASGWARVTLGYELPFASGSGAINVGDTVTNGTGASAVVTGVKLRSGENSWSGTAIGTLFFTAITGTFAAGDPIKVGATQKAVATSISAPIQRLPGGRLEIVKFNFGGSASTLALYGVDGVNKAFQFDGTNYWPIRTGMIGDTPNHVACHKNCLFLSFGSSVQYSAPGQPFAWTVVLGANEIGTGDHVTGMQSLGGDQAASALAIFTRERMHVLYGSSNADFRLQTSVTDIGFAPYTVQPISNTTFGVTPRGIQSLVTTQAFGDFQSGTVSFPVQPIINRKRGMEIASTTIHAKNQYRLFYGDGTALVVGLTGDKVTGILPLNYGKPVRCIWTSTWTTGEERTFFGSDDGFVYEDGLGTSFDGAAIEAWLRLVFNHQKSPRVRKRYRRAALEATVDNFAKVNCSFDLGYGNPDVTPPPGVDDTPLAGSTGGYWDQFIWDEFSWDTQAVLNPSIPLEGTEKNISLVFYSNRAQDASHTLQGVALLYTPRRIER